MFPPRDDEAVICVRKIRTELEDIVGETLLTLLRAEEQREEEGGGGES